jgi:predicted DNA binding protein
MEDIWGSVPIYKKHQEIDICDIETYFNELYEDKKIYLFKTYKDNIAEKMLEDYKSGELSNLRKLYYKRFNHLLSSFKDDLCNGKDKSVIRFNLYGPDDHYTDKQEEILNKALNNFCFRLSTKNYLYNIREGQEIVNDFMEGMCTIGYKSLEITLK